MLRAFSRNQLEQTPEICLMLSLHLAQSWRIMAFIFFNANCLAKWPWCEVDDDGEAWEDEEGDARSAAGPKVASGCVGWLV